MSNQMSNGETDGPQADKRRLMITQILKSPVLNPAGAEVGRVEDLIVKLGEGGGAYPPVTGIKVRIGGSNVYVGLSNIEKLEPGEVRLSSPTLHTGAFQRRPGEVLLAADVLGRHLMDVARGRIVQAHDLVLGHSAEGWVLLGVDRSPRAMLRRLIPRRARPDLRRHAILDVFEELDTEHQVEFLKSRSNEEAAKVLGRMAPDDAADLLAELDHDRLTPVLSMMPAPQQTKLRKLLQYHPTTAGGMMNPDYISVVRGTSAADALERVRTDDKAPHQLLSTVFVTDADGKFIGSLGVVDLLRSDPTTKVEDEGALVDLRVTAGADLTDVSMMMADYNLTALAVTDTTSNLVGAISVDDVLEALVPENWRNRVEASSGV